MGNLRIHCSACGEVSNLDLDTPHVVGIWEGAPWASTPRSLVAECPRCEHAWGVDLGAIRLAEPEQP
jgi:hypothetical protein